MSELNDGERHGVKRALVIGAGTMGAGIAEVCAKAGVQVALSDVSRNQLASAENVIARSLAKAVDKGKLDQAGVDAAKSNLRFTTELDTEGVDLVVEAVPEDMELKKSLFGRVGQALPDAILATNTSSLSVTEIAAATARPDRVIGMHFFNPPPVMPLIELVTAVQTSPEVLERALAFAEAAEKNPIVVQDRPGFATSRLGIVIGMEAIRMVESGVASVADIDRAMTLGYRHPMGPLELTDLVGLDVRLAIAEHLTKELGPQFSPPPLLRQLVRAGKLGKKTGEGFYIWQDGRKVPSSR